MQCIGKRKVDIKMETERVVSRTEASRKEPRTADEEKKNPSFTVLIFSFLNNRYFLINFPILNCPYFFSYVFCSFLSFSSYSGFLISLSSQPLHNLWSFHLLHFVIPSFLLQLLSLTFFSFTTSSFLSESFLLSSFFHCPNSSFLSHPPYSL